MISYLVLVSLLLTSIQSYSPCGSSPFPYIGKDIVIPIQQVQQTPTGPNVNASSAGFTIKVSGNVRITQQCGFTVTDFTYTGPGVPDTSVWYGAIKGDTTGFGMSLTDNQPVIQSPTQPISQNFLFTNRTGASISYNDFNVFQLFTLQNNFLIARAEIPNGIPIPPPGSSSSALPTGVVTSTRTVAASTTAATKTSSLTKTPSPTNNPSSASSLSQQGLLILSLMIVGLNF